MKTAQLLEALATEDARAIIIEGLRDEVAVAPPGVELRHKDKLCEEWVVYTAMGAIPLVFYYTGQAVINTAPYGADTLTWIAAKAKLMEVLHG